MVYKARGEGQSSELVSVQKKESWEESISSFRMKARESGAGGVLGGE